MDGRDEITPAGLGDDDQSSTLFDTISEFLTARDKPAAVSAALTAVREGQVSIEQLYLDVLAPLLAGVAVRWQAGETHVWEEHFASGVVRTVIEALYEQVQAARESWPPIGRTVVLACPPEETHDLGLRMLADRFEMAGWTAIVLGADTPVAEIVVAARAVRAQLVCLSASTHFHRTNLRAVFTEVRAGLPGVTVAVGGPAFAREREGWPAEAVLDVDRLIELDGDPPAGR